MKRETPRPAIGHIPFKGHRTLEEVRQDEYRAEILQSLGIEQKKVNISEGMKASLRG